MATQWTAGWEVSFNIPTRAREPDLEGQFMLGSVVQYPN